MNPVFKRIQELVCNKYFMYLSHPQHVQQQGIAGIRALCDPETSLSRLEEMANTSHSIFSFPHPRNESKRKFTSAGKEPSAFSKTAGKASAHLPKTPIFTLEEHWRAKPRSFFQCSQGWEDLLPVHTQSPVPVSILRGKSGWVRGDPGCTLCHTTNSPRAGVMLDFQHGAVATSEPRGSIFHLQNRNKNYTLNTLKPCVEDKAAKC